MAGAWSDGYISDINYTYGFYHEMTPAHLSQAALIRRMRAPSPDAKLNYCELGCGQGYGTNVLAAANPHINFVANDFNPSQIAGARALAAEAGLSNVRFLDDSFAQMVERTDLPEFDIISLHGIYSWISAENRAHIVEFIRRRLKVGGMVYISYNAMPGWAAAMPLRRLLTDEAAHLGNAPIVERIDQAMTLANELAGLGVGYFNANPSVGERLKRLEGQSRSYLAHEYFNQDWTPFYVTDVAGELSAAKLDWACSANMIDCFPALSLKSEQQQFLAKINPPIRREMFRDIIINQQFRRDIFVKGSQEIPVAEADRTWAATVYTLVSPRQKIALRVNTPLGQVELQQAIYQPVIDALAKGPASGSQLYTQLAANGLQPVHVAQAVNVLNALGFVQPALSAQGIEARRVQAHRFNDVIMRRALYSGDLVVLASPLTGSGLSVDRIIILFLFAIKQQQEPVQFAFEALEKANQRLMRDGKPVATAEENRTELASLYQAFVENGHLEVYRHLQLI